MVNGQRYSGINTDSLSTVNCQLLKATAGVKAEAVKVKGIGNRKGNDQWLIVNG